MMKIKDLSREDREALREEFRLERRKEAREAAKIIGVAIGLVLLIAIKAFFLALQQKG